MAAPHHSLSAADGRLRRVRRLLRDRNFAPIPASPEFTKVLVYQFVRLAERVSSQSTAVSTKIATFRIVPIILPLIVLAGRCAPRHKVAMCRKVLGAMTELCC